MYMHVVMGLVGDCSGGRDTRDSARLKCMFTEIVLLRLDIESIIDWAVGWAAWQYFRWIQISFKFNGLYLVDESKVRMVVPARDSGMRQAMHIRSTHLLVELHKSYERLQLHQTKQSHVATMKFYPYVQLYTTWRLELVGVYPAKGLLPK